MLHRQGPSTHGKAGATTAKASAEAGRDRRGRYRLGRGTQKTNRGQLRVGWHEISLVRVRLLIKQIARAGAPRAAEGARSISSGQHDRGKRGWVLKQLQ